MLAGLGHRLRHLLRAAGLAKSTYYHLLSHPAAVTRPDIEPMVAEIFARTPNGCGHRQIRMCLVHEFGVRVSHKSVLKVMRRMGLECRIRRPNPYRKYSSYRDETGARCLCSISCCGFSHDDFSGLGRACRPRNGLNWMVLVSPPERTGKDYDQHAPSTVYPSFAAERGIRRVDRAENTCRRSRRCVSTSRRRICRPCRR